MKSNKGENEPLKIEIEAKIKKIKAIFLHWRYLATLLVLKYR